MFVETATRVEARLVERTGHRLAFAHQLFEISEPARGEILLRTDAHHALERPLQVKHADAGLCSQLGEPDCLAVTRVEQTADSLHELNLRIDHVYTLWFATQARAEACLFGSFGQVVELHAFAMRTTRRTR